MFHRVFLLDVENLLTGCMPGLLKNSETVRLLLSIMIHQKFLNFSFTIFLVIRVYTRADFMTFGSVATELSAIKCNSVRSTDVFSGH